MRRSDPYETPSSMSQWQTNYTGAGTKPEFVLMIRGLVRLEPRRCSGSLAKREALISALGNRVAAFAIGVEAAEIDSELPGLPWNVGAEIPGIRLGIERAHRNFGGVRDPAILSVGRRLDNREIVIAHVHQTVADPVDMLFDRRRHIGENGRTERPSDGEKIGKTHSSKAEIGSRSARPFVAQAEPATSAKIDREQWTGDRVEAGRKNQCVEFVCV